MRTILPILFSFYCIIGSSQPCLAASATLSSQAYQPISLLAAAPSTPTNTFFSLDHYRPRPAYSARKERIANAMLISGTICLSIGIPLIIQGVLEDKKEMSASQPRSGLPRSLAFGMLGAVTTTAGLGLVIPGAIIRHRNHRRLQERQ